MSAGMRPGCGLKYRVGWVSLPGTPYRPNQHLKANPTVDSKALFHRRRGGGLGPGPRTDSSPVEGRKEETEREREREKQN